MSLFLGEQSAAPRLTLHTTRSHEECARSGDPGTGLGPLSGRRGRALAPPHGEQGSRGSRSWPMPSRAASRTFPTTHTHGGTCTRREQRVC